MDGQRILFGLAVSVALIANMSPLRACDAPSAAIAPTNASHTVPEYTPPSKRLDPLSAINQINEIRKDAGLHPLTIEPILDKAAFSYATELSTRDDLTHYGLDGSTPVTRIADTGYDAVTVGENLASGQRHFDDVLNGWMNSPSHRKTLLSPNAIHAGLALVYNPETEYRTFWTMVIAEPF